MRLTRIPTYHINSHIWYTVCKANKERCIHAYCPPHMSFFRFSRPRLQSDKKKTWLSRLNHFPFSYLASIALLPGHVSLGSQFFCLFYPFFHLGLCLYFDRRGSPVNVVSSLSFLALITERGARNSVCALIFFFAPLDCDRPLWQKLWMLLVVHRIFHL